MVVDCLFEQGRGCNGSEISVKLVQRDQGDGDQSGRLQRTYKEFFSGIGKCGLFGGFLHVGIHVDELGLLVEFGLEGLQEGVARHGAAASTVGAGGRLEGGRRGAVAEWVVGGELEVQAGRGPPVCR